MKRIIRKSALLSVLILIPLGLLYAFDEQKCFREIDNQYKELSLEKMKDDLITKSNKEIDDNIKIDEHIYNYRVFNCLVSRFCTEVDQLSFTCWQLNNPKECIGSIKTTIKKDWQCQKKEFPLEKLESCISNDIQNIGNVGSFCYNEWQKYINLEIEHTKQEWIIYTKESRSNFITAKLFEINTKLRLLSEKMLQFQKFMYDLVYNLLCLEKF